MDSFRRAWGAGYGLGLAEVDALLYLAEGPASVAEVAQSIGLGVDETRRVVERLVFVDAADIKHSLFRREAAVSLTERGRTWAGWGTAHLTNVMEEEIGPDPGLAHRILVAAELVYEQAHETRVAVRSRGRASIDK